VNRNLHFYHIATKKITAGFLAVFLLFNTVFLNPEVASAQFLHSALEQAESEDLILVLAESSLLEDGTNYQGLSQEYRQLSSLEIEDRVKRYATNLSKTNKSANVDIVSISKNQSPVDIADFLKQVYLQNNPAFQNQNLTGVVLIGKVAIPSLQMESGSQFSMYPYTDFLDPVFKLDPLNKNFVINPDALQDPEPEIFHGVIDFDTPQELAQYLDKNHLYYEGHPDFANIEKKMFVSEPKYEIENLNTALVERYTNFLLPGRYLVDNKVSAEMYQQLTGEELAPPDKFAGDLLEKQYVEFIDLFQNAIANTQREVEQTGRYRSNEYSSPLIQMAAMDKMTLEYFHELNKILETEFMDIANAIQENIDIYAGGSLSIQTKLRNGRVENSSSTKFLNGGRNPGFVQVFLDLPLVSDVMEAAEIIGLDPRDLITEAFDLISDDNAVIDSHLPQIAGVDADELTAASQCRLYKGGGMNQFGESTVTKNRALIDNQNPTDLEVACYPQASELDDGKIDEDYWEAETDKDDLKTCTQFGGQDLKDKYRTSHADLEYNSLVTAESCFAMRTAKRYRKLILDEYDMGKDRLIREFNRPQTTEIVLDKVGGRDILLSDLIPNLPGYTGRDATDWHAWSAYLFGNPIKNSFVIQEPYGPDSSIEEIKINVSTRNYINTVDSLIKHDSPHSTDYRNSKPAKRVNFPVDTHPFVSFYDREGNMQKLTIPNIFDYKSFDEFENAITQISSNLIDLGSQVSLFEQLQEKLTSQKSDQLNSNSISKFSKPKLQFLLDYQGLDINQRYTQILNAQINNNFEIDLFNLPKTFELAHITSDSSSDSILFSITDDPDLFDPPTIEQQDQSSEILEEDQEPEGQFEDLLTYFTEYLPSWYDQTVENIDSVVSFAGSPLKSFDEEIYNTNQTIKNISLEAKAEHISLQEPKSFLVLQALDEFKLPINPQDLFVTINVNGPAELTQPDQDPSLQGHQLLFDSQKFKIQFQATGVGDIDFQVTVEGFDTDNIFDLSTFEQTASQLVTVHQEINPEVEINTSELFVNSENKFRVNVQHKLSDGTVIESQRPSLDFSTKKIVEIVQANTPPQQAFEHEFVFKPLTSASQLDAVIKFNSGSDIVVPFEVKPNPAKTIETTDNSKLKFNVNSDNEFVLSAYFKDEFGNIDTNYSQLANLNLTSPQSLIVESQTVQARNGVAEFPIQTRSDKFGSVSFDVTSQNLKSSPGRIKLLTGLSNSQIENFESKSLIYNLVTTESEYLSQRAQKLLNSGITQSVITNMHNHQNPQILAAISPKGGVSIEDTTTIKPSLQVRGANIKAQLLDKNDTQLLQVTYTPGDLPLLINQGVDYAKSGLFINLLSEDLSRQDNQIYLLDQAILEIENNIPRILDNRYKLELLNSKQGLEFGLFAGKQPLIYFAYNFSQNSQVQLVKNQLPNELSFYNIKLGDNTNVPASTVIGSSSLQTNDPILASRQSQRHISKMQGFSNGDKTNLFLTSSMPVGDSVRPYQDISSVVIGDPNIRLAKTRPNFNSNMIFDQQIGQYLGRMNEDITKVLNTDDSIIFAEKAGLISIYDKDSSRLYKNVAKIPGGIKNINLLKDGNNKTLLILSDEQCLANDNCLYYAQPTVNDFNLQKANFQTNSRILQTYSLNVDNNQTPDVLTFDSSGNLDLYLNPNLNNSLKPLTLTKVTTALSSFDIDIFDFLIQAPEGSDIGILNLDKTQTEIKAASLKNSPKFEDSSIQVRSSQGTSVGAGDIIDIVLNINSQGQSQSSTVAFDLPYSLELIESSLTPDNAYFANTSDSIFNKSINNLNIRSGLNQIRFQARVLPQSSQTNPIIPRINVSSDQSGGLLKNLDIFTSQNELYTHLQLNLSNSTLRVRKSQRQIASQALSADIDLPEGLPNPDELDNMSDDELNNTMKNMLNNNYGFDSDSDGILDEFDSYANAGNKALESMQDGVKEFFCEGAGCLITPINKAFLVPPTNPVPMFGWGCPNPTTIATSLAALSCIGGRMYFSPTLTGEFATAVCLGPYLAPPAPGSPCWFASLFDLGSACEAINKKIEKLMNAATDFVTNGVESATGIGIEITDKKNITIPAFPSFLSNWVMNQFDEVIKAFDVPDITIIVPDFTPSSDFSITDPVKSAKEEFGYLVSGPDVDRFNPFPRCPVFKANEPKCGNYKTEVEFNKAKKSFWTKFSKRPEDLLSELSKMPAINLNPVPVNFNIPELPPKIGLKYQKDILLTIQANMISFLDALARWGCLPRPDMDKFNEFARNVNAAQSLADIPEGNLSKEQRQEVTFGKIFGSLIQTWKNTNIAGDAGVIFRYNKKDYATFDEYIDAIELAYKGYSATSGITKMIEDMIVRKELSNFIKIANEKKLRETPPNQTAQACLQLGIAFEGFVGNLRENLEILRAYRDIPKQIFEIENILYFYSDQAAKYLDVILGEYLSFIANNTSRIQAWTNTVTTLQNLIKDFNLLLDISAKFVSQCDDCRTDRGNLGMKLVFDMLLGAPNLPVMRFDIFPDFVLDLSDIQGGLEIDVPIPKINRQVMDLPEFKPVIIWPDAPRFDFIAFVDGIEVPLIPEPPKLEVELPPLPELNTFKLPVLPNPPDISQLDLDLSGRLEAPMEFIQNVFDLLCLIRKGLTPVPENTLATSIESITNRPLTPVLPWDKGFKIKYPGYSGEYIEKYKVTLQSRLNFGFDKLVQLVESPAKSWNDNLQVVMSYYQKIVDEVEENLAQEIQVLSGLEDLGAKLPQEKSLVDVIADLPNEIEKINKSLDKIAESKNQNTHLKAVATPVNYQELDKLASQIPHSQKIANYKHLSEDSQKTLNQLHKYLDQNKPQVPVSPKLIASSKAKFSSQPVAKNVIKTMPIAFTETINIQKLEEIQPLQDQQTGIFINDNQNQVQNIVKNKQHSQSTIRVTMSDIDLDNDIDVLYSADNEFYIKENLKNLTSSISSAKRPSTYSFQEVYEPGNKLDMILDAPSVSSNHNSVQIQIPAEIGDNAVIVNVYKNSLSARNPYRKIAVSTQIESKKDQAVLSIDDLRVAKGDFASFESIQSSAGLVNIGLPLGIYSFDIFIVDNQSLKTYQKNINFTVDICADRTPPTIVLNPNINQLVYRALHKFDLSDSFDQQSGLKSLFVDINPNNDSNSDGIRDNDADIDFNVNTPIKEFSFGPFEEFTTKAFKVHATDFANNSSQEVFSYPIQTPRLVIDKASFESIKGHIEPKAQDFPIEIVQKTNNSSQIFAETKTNTEGKFEVSMFDIASNQNPDLNADEIEDLINNPDLRPVSIEQAGLADLFDISKENGNVISKHPQATVEVRSNTSDTNSSHYQLYFQNQYLTSIHKTGDSNLSVDKLEVLEQLASATNPVSIVDMDATDSIEIESVGFDNPELRGSAFVTDTNTNQVLFILKPNGANITSSNDVSLEIEKITDLTQDQKVFVKYQGAIKVAYLIKAANTLALSKPFTSANQESQVPQITDANQEVSEEVFTQDLSDIFEQFKNKHNLSEQEMAEVIAQLSDESKAELEEKTPRFADIDPNSKAAETLRYLQEKGIIEGSKVGGLRYFFPNKLITRAEYAKIILKVLCISPRPESYLQPSVFDDIPFAEFVPWFYDETKETFLLGLFEGYKGERNSSSLLTPFKPLNPISQIEAVKVIMQALDLLKVIDTSEFTTVEPWYQNYLDFSQDLTPIQVGELKQEFLLTKEEAESPNKKLTRIEFAEIAKRTLDIRNCIADREALNLPTEDIYSQSSIDQITATQNTQSKLAETNPEQVQIIQNLASELAKLIDQASTPVETQSQPEAQSQQSPELSIDKSESVASQLEQLAGQAKQVAINIVDENNLQTPISINPESNILEDIACDQCPCQYTISSEEFIQESDVFFAILRNEDKSQVLDKSNALTITNE